MSTSPPPIPPTEPEPPPLEEDDADVVAQEPASEATAAPSPAAGPKQFPCRGCGATLVYRPGSGALTCEYCGADNPIPQSADEIEELDFRAHLEQHPGEVETHESTEISCGGCGATVNRPEHHAAFECPFCGSDIVATEQTASHIKPRSLLPFRVDPKQGQELFRQWLKGLWFAPNKLKQYARREQKLRGVYTPYWTYDANTVSHYTGQRGDDYYVTKTKKGADGKTRTVRERRTRWTHVSGVVFNSFDDVLVLASHSLPQTITEKLEPWDLENLEPYADEYLAGFTSEVYQVDLEQGFEQAKLTMAGVIERSVRNDIGGDRQRVHSVRTQYNNVRFKHLLLPVWISAYRFRDKVYRFVINARTGEVQGERPWSAWKIAVAVSGGLVVLLGLWLMWQQMQ